MTADALVPDAALAQIVRDEAGLIVAALYRRIGDFDVAEEAVQEAVVAALHSWRVDGVPANPGAWLTLTARRGDTEGTMLEASVGNAARVTLRLRPNTGRAEREDAQARLARVALTLTDQLNKEDADG